MKIKYIIYTLLVVSLVALIFHRISANKKLASGGPGGGRVGAPGGGGSKGGPGGGGPPMQVNGIIVAPQKFDNSLSVTGSIEANEQIEIRAQVAGLIRSISFEEGTTVRKGQVLVRIDDTELRARLAEALSKQGLAAENARRATLLLQKEAISREEADIARAELKSLQAQTQLIRAQLVKTVITAPFSGRIGLRNISTGGYLTPETVVANLVSTNPVKLTLSIPEKYSNEVKPNTPIRFKVAGSPETHTGTIYAIEPGIEATSRTLQLRARADNTNGALRPGSFANIELPLNTIPDALLVPSEAVVPVQGGKKVFITENGKAKEIKIETSSRTEKDVLVISGLKAGDTVLTTGIMTLKPDAAVKVKIAKKG